MTGSAKVTLDTNILIYAVDSSEDSKHLVAGKLLLQTAAAKQPLMLQCLNEFSKMVIQKRLMPLASLKRAIEYHVESFTLEAPSAADLYQAIEAQGDHKLPFWDALLWATARRAGCKIIFTEDFQNGRELDGVRFINPFVLTRRELQSVIP